MKKYTIEFFDLTKKNCPVADFLDSLEKKTKAKVLQTIDLLENNGPELREPYSKLIKDGIFELRIRMGNNNTRILYFFYYERKIILTNGFIKKTNKTPVSEIELAKKYKAEYERRKG